MPASTRPGISSSAPTEPNRSYRDQPFHNLKSDTLQKMYTHTEAARRTQHGSTADTGTRRILAARYSSGRPQKRKPHNDKGLRSRSRRARGLSPRYRFEDGHGAGAPHRGLRNPFSGNHHQRRILQRQRLARGRQDARRSRGLVLRELRARLRKAHATQRRPPRENHRLPRDVQASGGRFSAAGHESQHPPSRPAHLVPPLHGREGSFHLRRKLRRRASPQSGASLSRHAPTKPEEVRACQTKSGSKHL